MERGGPVIVPEKHNFATKDQFMHMVASSNTQLILPDLRNLPIIHGRFFLAQLLLLTGVIGAYVYLLQVRKPMEHRAPWASSIQER